MVDRGPNGAGTVAGVVGAAGAVGAQEDGGRVPGGVGGLQDGDGGLRLALAVAVALAEALALLAGFRAPARQAERRVRAAPLLLQLCDKRRAGDVEKKGCRPTGI